MNIINGTTMIADAKIGIVISRFNYFINKNLLDGALDTFQRIGNIKKDNITIVWVPGAYEIALASKKLIIKNVFNAILTLGTIIKGNTKHFDIISNECISSISSISREFCFPIIFGILTTENIDQALERCGIKLGNKGSEYALSTLEMISVLNQISEM